MECANEVFPLMLYMCGCLALLALTVVFINLVGTLKHIDTLVKDLSNKSAKLDGTFDLVEKSSSAINGIADTLGTVFSGKIINNITDDLKEKKTKKEEDKKGEDKDE